MNHLKKYKDIAKQLLLGNVFFYIFDEKRTVYAEYFVEEKGFLLVN